MWPELRTILMSYICHLFVLDTNHIIISSAQEEDYPIVDVLRSISRSPARSPRLK